MTVKKIYYAGGRGHRKSDDLPDERGEGVISTAIAVLVMAFIGVAMWVAFDATFNHAATHVDRQVNCIGQSDTSC
ncbi:MAG: hypothetical protein JO337_14040 [Acidimicrobiales bacterium]|nr:hypothetical protein [Acidimicrobiales bacterium]